LFLHRRGYNFFNIGGLTWTEIDVLVDSWNREQREKERQYKKNSKKSKKR